MIGEVQIPVAAALLRAVDRRRHSLFQDRRAAWPRRAGDHDPANLHPLPEPHQNLPVLRHRPIARGRPHHRAQDAAATRRSRQGSRRARRRQTYGDDHRHAARQRSRRRNPVREPSAVKAAVDLPIQGQCEPPDDESGSSGCSDAGIDALGMHLEAVTESVRPASCPARRRCRWSVISRVRSRGAGIRPGPGLHLYPGRARRQPRRDSGHSERLVASASIPSWCRSCRSPARRWKAIQHHRRHSCTAFSPLAKMLVEPACKASNIKAGCGKCGACSALSTYEKRLRA